MIEEYFATYNTEGIEPTGFVRGEGVVLNILDIAETNGTNLYARPVKVVDDNGRKRLVVDLSRRL